ncbi:MAG TPA: hypothetical protein VN516_03470, partial [Candidatus Baltobacteraceae bacterium]|nr:hypothetical protein [Candidatus Baltobacteraceae bacterium]
MLPEWTVVGFSGHRKLAGPQAVAEGIQKVLARLKADCNPLAAISSAASGADTLFVEAIAALKLPRLLILPFPAERFRQDFSSDEWERIWPHIQDATHVEEIAGEETDEQAYMETGIVTVDRSDVMI